MKSAPQLPCADASVSFKHFPDELLQPTACARSHCSCAVHASLTLPGTGVMHVDCPAGHAMPALHELRTHGDPGNVAGWHTPQAASGARAQNVVAHCASSAHAPFTATVPGSVLQAAPNSPARKAGHASAAMALSHAAVFDGVERVDDVELEPAAPPVLVSWTAFVAVDGDEHAQERATANQLHLLMTGLANGSGRRALRRRAAGLEHPGVASATPRPRAAARWPRRDRNRTTRDRPRSGRGCVRRERSLCPP